MDAIRDDFTHRSFGYYVEKFQRRLFRRLVEYQILQDHLQRELDQVGPQTRALLALDPEVMHDFAVKDHIEKACLTGMKAEFELFFTIYCTLVLDHQIRLVEEGRPVHPNIKKLLQKTVMDDKFAKDFVASGLSQARRISVEQIVPKMGLPNLENVLLECGWDVVERELDIDAADLLGEEFSGCIKSPWSQIQMAFQVRHAIEHNFSKVSPKGGFHYRAITLGALGGSTWSRWWSAPPEQPQLATECGLGTTPQNGDRILIDRMDIRGTAAAMSWVGKRLLKHWSEREHGERLA